MLESVAIIGVVVYGEHTGINNVQLHLKTQGSCIKSMKRTYALSVAYCTSNFQQNINLDSFDGFCWHWSTQNERLTNFGGNAYAFTLYNARNHLPTCTPVHVHLQN